MRAVAEDKIAPYAAEVDEDSRYPQEAHDALVASDFFAPHVGEEYGGVGADASGTAGSSVSGAGTSSSTGMQTAPGDKGSTTGNSDGLGGAGQGQTGTNPGEGRGKPQ